MAGLQLPYLIDRKTRISPKLQELEGLLDELVIQNGRKVVIFSEWTTMTMLIGKHLSEMGIAFVELSGKIPVTKRQSLIDEFTTNPQCKVFLSTDAGGTGLNLQAADCVINFELPWNPARLNQGMSFISGLLEMATGKKIEPVDGDSRLLWIDTATGEVTMKFKLPGFS